MEKILLVEDEQKLRRILKLVLKEAGYKVKTAAEGREAIGFWGKWKPDLVITDLKMEPVGGLEVLRYGQLHEARIPCIILTAFGTVEGAVDAMKNGAFDFLTKPVDHGLLLKTVRRAIVDNAYDSTGSEIIGSSDAMAKVREEIVMLAASDSAVLIRGESGTGKDLVAQAIHAVSTHNQGPFIRVNCASIPRELLESSLFGHRKGAFTGAVENRCGAFEQAENGVLFLDEIGDLSIELQPKILHAVEEKEITPVGSGSSVPVKVKILSATNRNLEQMIEENQFRADLYYRLNTMQLVFPPLRERREDIALLAEHFLSFFCREFKRSRLVLDPDTLRILEVYSWPGNVRELRNVIERAVIGCKGEKIRPAHLTTTVLNQTVQQKQATSGSLDLIAREQEMIRVALQQCNWNQSHAAKKLNLSRSALRYRLQKYGIKR